MAVENVKNLIIGSGAGGKIMAWNLGPSEKTAVVERRWIGGSCPNINCLPSKNEIWSAKVADLVHHASKFGISTGAVSIDMTVVRKRKREMVQGLVDLHLDKYKASGAELIMGEAKFTGPRTVEVKLNDGGRRTLIGERVFVNVGTHGTIPAAPGLADARPMTNIELLEIDRLPEHLIVIGGGYVGLEFAQAYKRFGSKATVVQHGPQLLSDQDADVSAEVTRFLLAEGIDVIAPADILRVEGKSGAAVSMTLQTSSGERRIQGSDILVAVGRTPNTAGIGLEAAGVELDSRGFVKVNERLETSAANVWALGECAGSPQFTHVSENDFQIVFENLKGGNRSTRGRVVPSCLYTDPPVAQIGLTESAARSQGIAVRLAKLPMIGVLRARTTGETTGFMKALIDASSDRILGFMMIGPEAGEVMAVVQTAMIAGLPYTALRDAILAHPTMAEGLTGLFSAVKAAGAAH